MSRRAGFDDRRVLTMDTKGCINLSIMQKRLPPYGNHIVQSLERAFDIINYIATKEPSPSLSEIGRAVGLSLSTVHRLLSSMQAKGVIEKDSAGRYRVGSVVLKWSTSMLHQGALADLVLPFLHKLREETNETVSFHALVGRHHVCIQQVQSRHEIGSIVEMGKATPLGLGASGRAILAYLPEEERLIAIRLWNSYGLPHIDAQSFEDELSRVRTDGVVKSLGERVKGAVSASAPVFSSSGGVVGAMTLSGPQDRLSADTLDVYAQRLKAIAARVSSELGHHNNNASSLAK